MWDNDVSAHAQTVAKAKYEFLFGLAEEKPSEMGKCYLLVLFPKKPLKPLRKVLQKLLPNDPTRAHSLCYTHHNAGTRPKEPAGLFPQNDSCSLSYGPTFPLGSPGPP